LSIVICYRVLHCSQRATPALGLECYADKFLISMSVEEITTDLHQSHHDTRLTVKRSLASSNRISPIPRSTFVAVICLDRLRSSSDAPAPRSSATAGPSEPLRSSHRSILPGHRPQLPIASPVASPFGAPFAIPFSYLVPSSPAAFRLAYNFHMPSSPQIHFAIISPRTTACSSRLSSEFQNWIRSWNWKLWRR
jgi:hypothetical protein